MGRFDLAFGYFEQCPGGCGRDRFDHDIMSNPCNAYLNHLKETNPAKYDRLVVRRALKQKDQANELSDQQSRNTEG